MLLADIKEKLLNTVAFEKYGRRREVIGALIASLSVVGLTTALPVAPVRAQASAPAAFGSVNVDQVLNESKARQRDLQELNGLLGNLRKVNESLQRGSGVFLSEAELRELAGLYEKATPTDAEKKRIAALETSGDTRKAELARLESTPQPSDEQRRRFNELGGMRQQGEQNLQQLGEDFQGRLRKREEELTTKTIAQIKDAIGAVAKSKNLAVVFDNKVAVYTANDITADVIKQVNK
jgi:Skp family chaperone for outer membrane proteins